MEYWGDLWAAREGRRELLREAQQRQLEREARGSRRPPGRPEKRPEGTVEVRWDLPEDEARTAELLELNGMPRWVAFKERFIVAERYGVVLAAVRYRTEPKRLVLGLLVTDPWADERRLAVALYAGARGLALELGAKELLAKAEGRRAAYAQEAGYHRRGSAWRMNPRQPVERREGPHVGGRGGKLARTVAFLAALLSRRS